MTTVLESCKKHTTSLVPTMVPARENLKVNTSPLPSIHSEIPSVSSNPSPLLCDFCGRSFVNPGNYQQHHIIHTGERPFKCYYCTSTFSEHSAWKEHLATHSKINTNQKQEENIQYEKINPLSSCNVTLRSSSLAISRTISDTETMVRKLNLDLNDKTVTDDNAITPTEMANARSGRLEQLIEALTKEVAQNSVDFPPDKKNQKGQHNNNTLPVKNALKNLMVLQANSAQTLGTNSNQEFTKKTLPSSIQYQCHFCPRSFPRARHLANHEKIHTRGKQNPSCGNSLINISPQVTLESSCKAKPRLVLKEQIQEHSIKMADNVIPVLTKNKEEILSAISHQFCPGVPGKQVDHQWSCDVCSKQCINESHLLQHQKIHTKHKQNDNQLSNVVVKQSQSSLKHLSCQQKTSDNNLTTTTTTTAFLQSSGTNTKKLFLPEQNSCYVCKKRLGHIPSENRVHGSPTNIFCIDCLHTNQILIFHKKDNPQTWRSLKNPVISMAKSNSGKEIDVIHQNRRFKNHKECMFYISKLKLKKSAQMSQKIPFFCKLCRKKFTNKSNFIHHSKQHPISKLNTFKNKYSFLWKEWLAIQNRHIYRCSNCDKRFKSLGTFYIHQRLHRMEFFVCGQCNVRFFLKNSLKYHSLKCGKDSSLGSSNYLSVELDELPAQDVTKPCCKESRLVPSEKICQTEPELSVVKWQCDICRALFNQVLQLVQHYQSDHIDSLENFQCPFCKQVCHNADQALNHLSSHEETSSNNNKMTRIKDTSNCQITADNLHLNIISEICDKSLSSMESITSHLHAPSNKGLPLQVIQTTSDVNVSIKTPSALNDKMFLQSNREQDSQILKNTKKLHQCEFCGKYFVLGDRLQINQNQNQCPYCKDSSSDRHNQQTHSLSYQCSACSQCYNSLDDLVKHQKERDHHPNANCKVSASKRLSSPYTYKCSVCQKVVRNLKIHMRIHDPNPDTVYACNICPKTFLQSGNLKQHLMMHSGERPLRCEFCDKGFIHSSHLKRHRQTHTGERPHECEYCQRTFAERAKLRMHLRTHTKEKPYACQYKDCGKSFSLKSVLDAHKLLHTGERPHSCEDCGRSFTQRCNLIAHRRIHTGEKPFKCKICHCAFRNSSNLKDHERLHSDDKPFKCHLCSKVFKRSDYLSKHLLVHSNERGDRNNSKNGSKQNSRNQDGGEQSEIINSSAVAIDRSPKNNYLPWQLSQVATNCTSSPSKINKNVQTSPTFAVSSIENVGFEQLIKTFSQEAAEPVSELMSNSVLDGYSSCGTVENVVEIYTEQNSVSIQMSEDDLAELSDTIVGTQIVSSVEAGDQDSAARCFRCHLCYESFDNAHTLDNHVLHIHKKGENQVDIAQQTKIKGSSEKSLTTVESLTEPGLDTKQAISEDLHDKFTDQVVPQPSSDNQSDISHETLEHLSELMYYLADYVKGDLEFQLIGNGLSLHLNSIQQMLKPLDKLQLNSKTDATVVTLIEFQTQPEQQSLSFGTHDSFACLLCLSGSPTIGTFAEHICKHFAELGFTSATPLAADSKKLSTDQNGSTFENAIRSTAGDNDLSLEQEFVPISPLKLRTENQKPNVSLTTVHGTNIDHISTRNCEQPENVISSSRQELSKAEHDGNNPDKIQSPSSKDSYKNLADKCGLKTIQETTRPGLRTGFFQDSDNDVLGSKENLGGQTKVSTVVEAEVVFSPKQNNLCKTDSFLQSNRNSNIKRSQFLPFAHSLDSSNSFEICLECKPGEKPFKCGICKKTFKKLKYVKDHIKLHVGKTSLVCEICGKVFRRTYNLKKHHKVHQSTNTGLPSINSLTATKDDDLSSFQDSLNGYANQPVIKCSKNLLDGQVQPYSCDICSKTFQLQVYLKQHMKIHTSAKPYICEHCNMGFSQRAYLTKHRRVHTGEKPYKCGYCDKGFARSELLTRHTRTHTKEKPYSCPHCSLAFALYNTLKRHLRTHTGQKPFECLVCGHAFTQRGNLSIHMRLHTGERPFKCDKCHVGFIHSSNLKKHLKSCNQNI